MLYIVRLKWMVTKFSALQAGVQDSCTCTSVLREGCFLSGLANCQVGIRKAGWVSEERQLMIKDSERKPHVEGRPVNRVSSAVWPVDVRRVVATGKAAQRRRDWIMQGRWWVILADALSMRVLFVLTTLLVVISSLLVALLGLQFWYILMLPLLLFALTLFVPLYLAGRIPVEAAPPTLLTFAQEFRSSTGLLSLHAHELRSNPGYIHELRSSPGLLSPATPMPADPPLVRVLVTYDLREAPVEHFLEDPPGEETGEYPAMRSVEKHFWRQSSGTEPLADHNAVATDQLPTGTKPLTKDNTASDSANADPGRIDGTRDNMW